MLLNSWDTRQPLPNAEPVLAGETGVSRDEGAVYRLEAAAMSAAIAATSGGHSLRHQSL
jgi:hypothetical protein